MSIQNATNTILAELRLTLDAISDEEVGEFIKEIRKAEKVFFVGVGRVLLSLEAIAKRLAHLGIEAIVVGEITEPAITDKDLLIVGSGSGESLFPLMIAEKAKQFGAKVAHIGSNPKSSMKEYSDLFLRIPVTTKLELAGEIPSKQPMTSLFEQSLLILGDAIALTIVLEDSIDIYSLWQFHANLE